MAQGPFFCARDLLGEWGEGEPKSERQSWRGDMTEADRQTGKQEEQDRGL